MGEFPGQDSVFVANCSPTLRSEDFAELSGEYCGLEVVVIRKILHDASHVHVHVND